MDLEPETSSPKRPRKKSVSAGSALKPKRKTLTVSRKKPAALSPAAVIAETKVPEDFNGVIARTAFYLAAERGFAPGHELDDWLEAERRVRALPQNEGSAGGIP
jgi:hypothetical protein